MTFYCTFWVNYPFKCVCCIVFIVTGILNHASHSLSVICFLVFDSWICDVELNHNALLLWSFLLALVRQWGAVFSVLQWFLFAHWKKESFLLALANSTPEMYQIVKTIPQCTRTQLEWGLKPLAFLRASFSNSCLLHLIHLNNINRAVGVYGEILSHLKSLEQ